MYRGILALVFGYGLMGAMPLIKQANDVIKYLLTVVMDALSHTPELPADPAASRSLGELCFELLPLTALILAGHIPAYFIARRLWPGHPNMMGQVDLVFSMPFYPVLTYFAIMGTIDTSGSLESRWSASSPRARFYLELYVCKQVGHLFVQFFQKMETTQLLLMTVHHLTSICCYSTGLVTGGMHFWGCLDGWCEMSTIFLDNMLLMRDLGDRWKSSPLYTVNGIVLWFSFFVFRLVLFPTWLFWWWSDIQTSPETTWDSKCALERYLYPSVTVLLLVLSVHWFTSLTRGMLKAVGIGQKSQKTKDE